MEVNRSTDKRDKRPDLLTGSETAVFTSAGEWRRGDKKRGEDRSDGGKARRSRRSHALLTCELWSVAEGSVL